MRAALAVLARPLQLANGMTSTLAAAVLEDDLALQKAHGGDADALRRRMVEQLAQVRRAAMQRPKLYPPGRLLHLQTGEADDGRAPRITAERVEAQRFGEMVLSTSAFSAHMPQEYWRAALAAFTGAC